MASQYDAAFANMYASLLNSPQMTTGTSSGTETREITPFQTTFPSPHYGDLIQRYQGLLGGGTGSFKDLIGLQRNEGLERLRNTQAARGVGTRSPVQAAASAQFLRGFEPQAAAMQAEYMKSLLGDYAGAVSQGAIQKAPVTTSIKRTGEETKPFSGGQVSYGTPSVGGTAPTRNRTGEATSPHFDSRSPTTYAGNVYGGTDYGVYGDPSMLGADFTNPYVNMSFTPAGQAPTKAAPEATAYGDEWKSWGPWGKYL